MYLHYFASQGGKRTLDIHHGGRVVFAAHFWPWMVGKRWKVEFWRGCEGNCYLDIGPFEFILCERGKS